MQPLYDLNLQQLEDAHVVGNWRVIYRRLNQADPDAPLVEAEKLRFEASNRLILQRDAEDKTPAPDQPEPSSASVSTTLPAAGAVGSWRLQRDPLLSRPYIKLHLPTGETRALITRMRRSKDGSDCEMMLYFQTGMEVQLQCA